MTGRGTEYNNPQSIILNYNSFRSDYNVIKYLEFRSQETRLVDGAGGNSRTGTLTLQ